MRLDKYFSAAGLLTRTETSRAVRAGRVTVDSVIAKRADMQLDETCADVRLDGVPVTYRRFVYLMMNKPEGVVCATEDGGKNDTAVVELLPEKYRRMGVFPCGRLDKNTTGLLLVTNDGDTAHRMLSPKYHVAKRYAFTCEPPLDKTAVAELTRGVSIGQGEPVAAAAVACEGNGGEITITEGKFHQIKRMFFAVGREITSLERVTFGTLALDRSLAQGEWRELTDEETASLPLSQSEK